MQIYKTLIRPVLTYGSATWTFTKADENLLRIFERRILVYISTAVELTPGGSSTVHIYTQTIHRTIQNKQYIEQHDNFGRVQAVPRLG